MTMTLDTTIHELDSRLAAMQARQEELLWAVVEAQPAGEGHALADSLGDAVQDGLSHLRQARQALREATVGNSSVRDSLTAVARGLVECQREVTRASDIHHDRLLDATTLRGLHDMARERSGSWRSWARGVEDALTQCRLPLHDVNQALLEAWNSITQHLPAAA